MPSIGVVLFPGFQVMNLAPLTAFEFANLELGRDFYDVTFLSEGGGPIRSSIGMVIETEPFSGRRFDTVLVVGSITVEASPPGLIERLRETGASARRVAATCTGAFLLAEAGLLDGRRAATHWAHARELQRLYPSIKVDDDRIFVCDGNVWTSAGMTAGIDLTLALVEDDLGPETAKGIARKLVVYHRRTGGQSQFSALLELQPRSDRVQKVLAYARHNLRNELSVEELAEAARLSPRQFSRIFREETGQSPAKAVENLRLDAARTMLEDGRHSLDTVARETGFADRERMRRAFLRAFGQPPQVIKRNVRHHAATEPEAAL
ncbi:GlxA family transcriptional regulator [Methylorubrum salsuginis]|uniref:Transcriptional regulator, AraC family with amidase-like domain n=1 Tax=Methylorubrum salsuginis TaxID=414703 RepID=A0A1I4FI75_9HYPH|nr:GlxA family transcriptional regulator [Methylorubrum salsuginis]SFL17010.1 transcriptional regulator, AraC family with amidase-like domain [Methylorubrum salsuginis]